MLRWYFSILACLLISTDAFAQMAPTGDHYGGRPSDTGFSSSVNAIGGYSTSIPFDFPATRDGTAIPVQIVSGGHELGAAGVGWDLPLSYIWTDNSIARRKPADEPGSQVKPRERVILSVEGRQIQLVPLDGTGTNWAGQRDATFYKVHNDGGGTWTVTNGHGKKFTFAEPPGHASFGMSLLTQVDGPDGVIMQLNTPVSSIMIVGGRADVVDLENVDYNFSSALGCAKNRIEIDYDAPSPTPLALSTRSGQLLARVRKIIGVAVLSRADCGSFTALRRYVLNYVPDKDTQMPRLNDVGMVGRDGTPEATKSLPIATYHYNSASIEGISGSIQYGTSYHVDVPAGYNNSVTGDTGTSLSRETSDWTPDHLVALPFATTRNLVDIDGDGLPDLVQESQGELWVARNLVPGTASPSFAQAVILGDSATHISGPLELSSLTQHRYVASGGQNHEELWRQLIDINGDGRLDIIDAAAQPGAWLVYLNTPSDGPSGVNWVKREIPISDLSNELATYGHDVSYGGYLPLARKFTGRQQMPVEHGVTEDLEITFTEWELLDVNGDGLPDFVHNLLPVTYQEVDTDDGTYQVPNPGPGTNSIEVDYNVAGIALDTYPTSSPHRVFSASFQLMPVAECGVEKWSTKHPGSPSGEQSYQECSFADVNGDGIPERIELGQAFLGTGNSYSQVAAIKLPHPYVGHQSSNRYLCEYTANVDFYSSLGGVLRDINGDGIPDLLDGNGDPAFSVAYLGTGVGFTAPVSVGITPSNGDEACDGSSSGTGGGAYDIDGDGVPEEVEMNLATNQVDVTALTEPRKGLGKIIAIDNGYGATLEIAYTSAKQDRSTKHQVPSPEVVVGSTYQLLSSNSQHVLNTAYAYGNASLVFDPIDQAFEFSGYRRTVEFRTGYKQDGSLTLGQATVTDTISLSPYISGSSSSELFTRRMALGRTSTVTQFAGWFGGAWSLLGVDTTNDVHITAKTDQTYTSQMTAEGVVNDAIDDCIELGDPYDYSGSFGYGIQTFGICRAYGFTYTASVYNLRGAPVGSANVLVQTNTLSVDNLGRPTKIEYLNDAHRAEDDLCVLLYYAASTGDAILDATSTKVVEAPVGGAGGGCDANLYPVSITTNEYDQLAVGQVSKGHATGSTVGVFTTDTGQHLSDVRKFDAIYNSDGSLRSITQVRNTDAASRTSQFQYDPFALVRTHTTVSGSNVPTLTTTVDVDPLDLQPTSVVDANGNTRGSTYDGYGRPLLALFTSVGGVTGVRSSTKYLGYDDQTGRRIATTVFGDLPAASQYQSAAGRTSTSLLDELGRPIRSELDQGSDYPHTVVVGNRVYDEWGRVSLVAEPDLKGANVQQTYSSNYYYNDDGTINCVVRGRGVQPLTAVTSLWQEVLPTCYYHGYSNYSETFGVSLPDANQVGTSQSGVLRLSTVSAIGRSLSKSTTLGAARLEYETFASDSLGNLTARVRYQDPVNAGGAVATTWRYDSEGDRISEAKPESALVSYSFDSWNELYSTQWVDGGNGLELREQFDALGRPIHKFELRNSVVDPSATYDYVYDAAAPVSSEVTPSNLLGKLAVAKGGGTEIHFSYDAFGRTNARTYLDADATRMVEMYTHRADGFVSRIDWRLPDNNYKEEYAVYYPDSAGRTVGASYVGPDDADTIATTSYDDFGRLIWADYSGTQYVPSYAPLGRRLLEQSTLECDDTDSSRALLDINYDANGRMVAYSDEYNDGGQDVTYPHTLGYDARGRLAVDRPTSSTSWSTTYDALDNVLVNSSANAKLTYHALDRDRVCRETTISDSVTSCNVSYDAIGEVIVDQNAGYSRYFTY